MKKMRSKACEYKATPIRGAAIRGYSFGDAMNYQKASPKCESPVEYDFIDLPIHQEGISVGSVEVIEFPAPYEISGRGGGSIHSFVFCGSRDLWLLRDSSVDNVSFFTHGDMPLDTFRPGCPTRVTWGVVSGHSMFRFFVENRSRARNGQVGNFIARLVIQVEPQSGRY